MIPYLTCAMADKLLLLSRDEELRRKMGVCGATKVRQRFTLDVMAPRLYQLIETVLDHPTTRVAPIVEEQCETTGAINRLLPPPVPSDPG